GSRQGRVRSSRARRGRRGEARRPHQRPERLRRDGRHDRGAPHRLRRRRHRSRVLPDRQGHLQRRPPQQTGDGERDLAGDGEAQDRARVGARGPRCRGPKAAGEGRAHRDPVVDPDFLRVGRRQGVGGVALALLESTPSLCYNAAAMAWYHRVPAPKLPPEQRKARMEGLWIKCDGCGEIIYKQDVEKNLEVCPKCDEHFPLPVRRRLELVLDPGSFAEHDIGLESTDPLQFSDSKRYRERIKASQKSANEGEAFISGIGRIAGREVSIGAFHFGFMGGSMGSVVGEKVTRVFERATDRRLPAIIFSASGGARMQEAIFSLTQMAKSSAALPRFRHVLLSSCLAAEDLTGFIAATLRGGDTAGDEGRELSRLGSASAFAGIGVFDHGRGFEIPARGTTRGSYLLSNPRRAMRRSWSM